MSIFDALSSLSSQPQAKADDRKPEESFIVPEPLKATLRSVQQRFAPVWPLEDYVAVNPYMGLADRAFLDARRLLRSVSDAETLMPTEYYRAKIDAGHLASEDIDAALKEIHADTFAPRVKVDDVLKAVMAKEPETKPGGMPHSERDYRSFTEVVDLHSAEDWTRIVKDEVGRFCAQHFDEGQAAWASPWKELSLYQAWQRMASMDRRFDALGVAFFCRFVDTLPADPEAAIFVLLRQLKVPQDQWEEYLYCLAHAIPGWAAWTCYRAEQADRKGDVDHDFIGLLAIRLAYDAAISEHRNFELDWESLARIRASIGRPGREAAQKAAEIRYVLLRASEIAYQRRLLEGLDLNFEMADSESGSSQKAAQMVFCIDVRSERYRRQVETASDEIMTYGFAGFFGVPMALRGMGEDAEVPQLPALLSPAFTVDEKLRDTSPHFQKRASRARQFVRSVRKAWKHFSTSAVGCFGFVETAGLGYGWKLFTKTVFGVTDVVSQDGVANTHANRLGPALKDVSRSGLSDEQQIDMAESILRGIGLVDDFAQLVIFCGHHATTQNNPLQASLDCGACCGHSGAPNGRFAAQLLNQRFVRESLKDRGIHIPENTQFLGAVHDTTTDEVSLFDFAGLPLSSGHALEEVRKATTQAAAANRLERMPTLNAVKEKQVVDRAINWSETRPEWGLAGNAAFIVAPRSVTAQADLAGRSFLHSYDFRRDSGFQVLEQIMTAPMVVANWINMQYYASSVDNSTFGSGTKTVHNVVGRMGVVSGNGGDLMTGLAMESLHDGQDFVHEPLRLLSLIAAPRTAVADIVSRHENVRDLLVNGWMNLVVIDDGRTYRFTPQQTWVDVEHTDLDQTILPASTNIAVGS